jgi:MoxR-like ATPase
VGQDAVVDQILLCIFSGGHALLVGVPGLAKTLLVNTLSQALGLNFKRIQFTPDLMPSDILGSEILDENRHFKFIKDLFFQILFLQMRSIEHHQKHKPHYWKQCKNVR